MTIKQTISIPELLAPAGSIEAFHSAIKAGADAIYLGLNDFNARMRAKNFTIKTLAYLVPYAHSKNVKVYVTLNIQFKQSEIEPLIHVFYQLDQIGIDAVIIADLGAISIARQYFPKLNLHGSTQMAIHNSAGVKFAQKIGLKRVVLARELSIDEISKIKKNSTIELETFVHGALCYSISGNCLASSILGGASGNRGRCTQVCRRKFSANTDEGYFFSPRDLCAIDYLSFYKSTGIASLKIEGRMKGAQYVYTVVNAYRNAIDNTAYMEEARKALTFDMGREKTTLFLKEKSATIIDPQLPPGTGLFLGTVHAVASDSLSLPHTELLEQGDRVRVQPKSGFEGKSFTILSIVKCESLINIRVKDTSDISAGDEIYLIGKKEFSTQLEQNTKVNVTPVPFKEKYNRAFSIVKSNYQSPKTGARNELWIKIDNPEWLQHLQFSPCQHLIFRGNLQQMRNLLADESLLKNWRSRLFPALPPFISENEIHLWKSLIVAFKEKGINRWACANIGQVSLFPPDIELVADNPIWALNYFSQSVLLNKGFKWFTYSSEDDYMNIKSTPSDKGILYLYSHIPLFISLIEPAITSGKRLTDPYQNSFITAARDGLHYLITEKPLCIFPRKEKLSTTGIHHFCIDLCFVQPDPQTFALIIEHYKSGTKIPGSEFYNFKAGLK